jgi:hypothetical protein
MEISEVWLKTYNQLDSFTTAVEKHFGKGSYSEIAPLWQMMESIRVKYVTGLSDDILTNLRNRHSAMQLTEFPILTMTKKQAIEFMGRIGFSCSYVPESEEVATK